MKRIDPEWLLETLGLEHKRSGAKIWMSCPSPDHRDSSPSCRVNADADDDRYGQWRCYGCGAGGWPIHLVEAVKGLDRAEAWAWIDANGNYGDLPAEVDLRVSNNSLVSAGVSLDLPAGVRLASQQHPAEWPIAYKRYLHGRGITVSQALRWDIGYALAGKQKGRVFLPIRDESGTLISYTGRTIIGSPIRYKNPSIDDGADLAAIFGVQHWGSDSDVVVVTEGGFNALAVERVSPPSWRVAALYGSSLHPRHLLALSRFDNILLATDPDGAGNRVSAELADELDGSANCFRVHIPDGLDCNDMSPSSLRSTLLSSLQ